MRRVSVLLGDDHAVVRTGIRMLLDAQDDIDIVGETDDPAEFLEMVVEHSPDVAVLETTLGGASSFPTMMELGRAHQGTRVLVLTGRDEQTFWRSAVAVGVSGYVVKHASAAELVAAVHAVSAGRSFISVSSASQQISGLLDGPMPEELATKQLSARESEVLVLLAQGHTYDEIGTRLYISTKTVGTYRTRLAEKLGLKSRAEIVRYALEIGILA